MKPRVRLSLKYEQPFLCRLENGVTDAQSAFSYSVVVISNEYWS